MDVTLPTGSETVLEKMHTLPTLQPDVVVRATTPMGPRVKKNPDGKMCHVRTSYVSSNKLWLVIVTYKPHVSFRVRGYLRRTDGTLLDLIDEDGFKTQQGAEWAAYIALRKTIQFLAGVRRAGARQ